MKCQLCAREIRDNVSECPRCGFPPINITYESEETARYIQQQADQFADNLLKDFSVSVRVYAYDQKEDGSLSFKEEREMPLAPQGSLLYRKTFWNEQEFSANKKITLDLVCRGRGKENRVKVTAPAPALPAPWKAGVKVGRDLTAAVVIGSEEVNTASATFDLLG